MRQNENQNEKSPCVKMKIHKKNVFNFHALAYAPSDTKKGMIPDTLTFTLNRKLIPLLWVVPITRKLNEPANHKDICLAWAGNALGKMLPIYSTAAPNELKEQCSVNRNSSITE